MGRVYRLAVPLDHVACHSHTRIINLNMSTFSNPNEAINICREVQLFAVALRRVLAALVRCQDVRLQTFAALLHCTFSSQFKFAMGSVP